MNSNTANTFQASRQCGWTCDFSNCKYRHLNSCTVCTCSASFHCERNSCVSSDFLVFCKSSCIVNTFWILASVRQNMRLQNIFSWEGFDAQLATKDVVEMNVWALPYFCCYHHLTFSGVVFRSQPAVKTKNSVFKAPQRAFYDIVHHSHLRSVSQKPFWTFKIMPWLAWRSALLGYFIETQIIPNSTNRVKQALNIHTLSDLLNKIKIYHNRQHWVSDTKHFPRIHSSLSCIYVHFFC